VAENERVGKIKKKVIRDEESRKRKSFLIEYSSD
jgi:hypothetical protein